MAQVNEYGAVRPSVGDIRVETICDDAQGRNELAFHPPSVRAQTGVCHRVTSPPARSPAAPTRSRGTRLTGSAA